MKKDVGRWVQARPWGVNAGTRGARVAALITRASCGGDRASPASPACRASAAPPGRRARPVLRALLARPGSTVRRE
jgi:hypothetical protein